MRILIQPGDWGWRNLGDVAMAQVAVRRLARLWPRARFDVMTSSEARLQRFCPGTFPVPADGQMRWLGNDNAFGGALYRRLVPHQVRRPAAQVETYVRCRWPRLSFGVVQLAENRRPPEKRTMTRFYHALANADLVVVSGAGDLTSAFEEGALRILRLLRLTYLLGKRTALFGQGIGPIESERLLRSAHKVLSRAEVVGIREKRAALPLLERIGVERSRVWVTGDDALDLISGLPGTRPGNGIGINVRSTANSALDRDLVAALRPILHEASRRYGTPLVPVPVLVEPLYDMDSDLETIGWALEGYDGEIASQAAIETPEQLIGQVSRCRVVVTASYHAAVFALGQGIPAVGLSRTPYYVDKFSGLADMFGGGCEVVQLDTSGFAERLSQTIDRLWRLADALRPQLRAAADRQIMAGRAAYERCYELITGHRPAEVREEPVRIT